MARAICAGQLSHSQELKKLLEEENPTSGFHAVLNLAWGVMLSIIGDDNKQTHSELQYLFTCLARVAPDQPLSCASRHLKRQGKCDLRLSHLEKLVCHNCAACVQ